MEGELTKIDWGKVKEIFAPERERFLEKVRRGLDKYPYFEEALVIMAGFGLVSLAVLMPSLPRLLAPMVRNRQKQRYRRLWKGLEKRKLVRIHERPSGPVVEITENGIKRALEYKLSEMKIKKPDTWDKKWRLIIFDVSEKKKRQRDAFRRHLDSLGFYRLNLSVFVHPYPCFSEIEFLRQVSGVGGEATYIEAEKVETDNRLKVYFNLQDD